METGQLDSAERFLAKTKSGPQKSEILLGFANRIGCSHESLRFRPCFFELGIKKRSPHLTLSLFYALYTNFQNGRYLRCCPRPQQGPRGLHRQGRQHQLHDGVAAPRQQVSTAPVFRDSHPFPRFSGISSSRPRRKPAARASIRAIAPSTLPTIRSFTSFGEDLHQIVGIRDVAREFSSSKRPRLRPRGPSARVWSDLAELIFG